MVSPRAGGHSCPQPGRGSTGSPPALVDPRGHGLRALSVHHPVDSSQADRAFKPLPLRYVIILFFVCMIKFLGMTNFLYTFFCSGRSPVRLGITPPPLHVELGPSLERVVTGERGSRLVVARPPLMGVASPPSVASVAVPVAAIGLASAATLVIPSPPGAEEERRDARLPASPGGGAHGLPGWS